MVRNTVKKELAVVVQRRIRAAKKAPAALVAQRVDLKGADPKVEAAIKKTRPAKKQAGNRKV
jgi:uncharacterized heparinase superfamily protein